MTALDHKCEVCKSPPGVACVNTIKPGTPLPGRASHFARSIKSTATAKETNDACY